MIDVSVKFKHERNFYVIITKATFIVVWLKLESIQLGKRGNSGFKASFTAYVMV